MSRAAEATRDPIWVVESRKILPRPDCSWEWCTECEGFYRHAEDTCPHGEEGALDAAEAHRRDSESFYVTWRGSGAIFLDRDTAETWVSRRPHHYPDGARVFCFALAMESPLREILNELASEVQP